MEDQQDQNPEESSSSSDSELEETETPTRRRRRLGRIFGFLGKWAFWWRLGVGMLLLGAGVLIGLGIAWYEDGDRRTEWDDHHEQGFSASEVKPLEEWSDEGKRWQDGRRFRPFSGLDGGFDWKGDRRGWFPERGPLGGEFRDRRGIYIPYEVLEELIEEAVEEIGSLIERRWDEGRFRPGMGWPDEFGSPDRFDNGEDREKRFWEENSWSEDGEMPFGEMPFEGLFGFAFGDILPDLAFLEDCELDFQSLSDIVEDIEDLEGSENEDGEGEDFEGFFQRIEELFDEACETPSEN